MLPLPLSPPQSMLVSEFEQNYASNLRKKGAIIEYGSGGGGGGGTLFQNNGFWGIVPNTSQLLNFYPAMNRNREGFQKFVKKMCIWGVRPNT